MLRAGIRHKLGKENFYSSPRPQVSVVCGEGLIRHNFGESKSRVDMRPFRRAIGCAALAVLGLLWNAATVRPAQDSTSASYKRGVALFDQGKFSDALDAFTQAIAEAPKNGAAYRQRARCRSRLDDPKGALADYDKAIELNPRDATAWNGRGTVKRELQDAAGALDDFNKAIEISPTYAAAFNNRALVLAARGEIAAAVADYDKSIELGPKQSPAYNNRGLARERLNDFQGALADYTRAIENDPKNADAYSNRGFCQNRMGNPEAARRDYQQALAITPGHKFASAQIKKLATGVAVDRSQIPDAETPVAAPSGTSKQTGTTAPAGRDDSLGVPVVTFEADDPCRSASTSAAGMPWQKAASNASATSSALPPGIQAAMPAPFLDINKISAAQHNGAVSGAMEGMRLLYGEMSPDQERQFRDRWAPLFDYPTPAAVEYLNTLNPLLGQFLAGREAFFRAAAAAEAAMLDSALAVTADSRDGYADAVAVADLQRQVLGVLHAGLVQIAAKIQALGNPPNPLEGKCEARRRYRRSLPANSSLDGEWVSDHGDRMYYKTIKRYPDGSFLIYRYSFAFAERLEKSGVEAGKPGFEQTKDGKGLILVPGLEDVLIPMEEQPGGMILAVPTDLGVSLTGFFLDGERLHVVRYGTHIQDDRWTYEGTTYYRAPLTQDTPPLLPGHTWEAVLEVANTFEAGRLGRVRQAKTNLASRLQELIACDPENLPVAPKIRQPWEEGPYKADDPRSKRPSPAPPTPPEATEKPPKPPGEATDPEATKDTIAFHRSMIELLNRNLQKDQDELDRETRPERRKKLAFRVVQLQSDMQAEQDLIASYETGQLVHTRSAFDEFAYNKFLQNVRQEGARADATRRIAAGVEEQIRLLPEKLQKSMREKSRRILDSGVIASGDVEKAQALAQSLNSMIEGYWEGEAARNEEREIDKQEYKAYVNAALMAAGAGIVGFGSAAFAATFGETAAITVWAPHLIGGIYGGGTGLMTGGPAEAVAQAIAWTGPIGFAATQFVEGAWHGVDNQKDATLLDRAWAGAKQAGTGYVLGKGIEFGAGLAAKGSLALFGENSILFKPVLGPSRNARLAFAEAKMKQDVKDAESLIGLYQEKQTALALMKAQRPAGSPELQQAEKELQRLAASLNSSYHCKWLLKYKAHPSVRRSFSAMVERSYEETTPEMLRLLEKQGYDVSNLRFKPTRNASSAGTSSMDLDLALQEPPGLVITKGGKPVSISEFQRDAQQALNEAYHSATGFSANRSEVNLTTSVHSESYASKALLKKNVNFSRLTPDEVASIGKVLNVKLDKIQNDPVLSEIAKVQSQCREAAKEIENMLLKDLRQKLQNAKPGSPEAQQAAADITYWTDMLKNFKQISMQETNPYTILELDRAVRAQTGGKGVQEASRDLSGAFGTRR